jgi:pantetheine-phosphate adenylyltransferase
MPTPCLRTALFTGSFDPFTLGHADIVERSLQLFDRVVVGVGYNLAKTTAETAQERVETIAQLYAHEPRVAAMAFEGLAVEFAHRVGAQCIVRGVRSVKDFEYERDMADLNRRIGGVETLLLYARPELAALSSSAVRELQALGQDVAWMLPHTPTEQQKG